MTQGTELPPAQKVETAQSAYLHPFACFRCRKSFKRATRSEAVLPCPECGGPSIGLTRKFKPPRQSDEKQWKKVEALVRHGFLFWSVAEAYPDTLQEVEAFAQRHADVIKRARTRSPEGYRQIDDAMSTSR